MLDHSFQCKPGTLPQANTKTTEMSFRIRHSDKSKHNYDKENKTSYFHERQTIFQQFHMSSFVQIIKTALYAIETKKI